MAVDGPTVQPSALPTPGGSMPDRARVVVIGAGVGGASIAFHLTALGESDVLVVDRAEPTSGSTFHSAGLVGQLRADPALTRMNMYSVELYRELEAGPTPVGWRECGGIRLASSVERLEEIRRQIDWAATYGLPLHEISVREVVERFPLVDADGLVGAALLESDGFLDPSQVCLALLSGARARGARVLPHTRVLSVSTSQHGRVRGAPVRHVTGVETDRGAIECEVVVDAAGMWAAEVARLVGVRVPVVPMSHQYVVTGPLPTSAGGDARRGAAAHLPTVRDPDLLVYFRPEGPGLLMGGYERNPQPWTVQPPSYDDIPATFNGRLLEASWERLEEIAANAVRRVPAMAEVGLRTVVNGPEAFTPDNEFCLGEAEVRGFFVAAGFCAHGIAGAGGIGREVAEWVLNGRPGLDLWHMDVNRFGVSYASSSYTVDRTVETYRTYYDVSYPDRERDAGRPLRVSPAYEWHRNRQARFTEKAGWERVDYFESNASAAEQAVRPAGWAGRSWSSAIAAECEATRSVAGLYDETSFAKLRVSGPDAAGLLELACDNSVAGPVGRVTYTQLLNDRGGIEADLTVTRLGDRDFLLVTGTASGVHDREVLRRLAADRGCDVAVEDVTASMVCFGLWGPAAVAILGGLTSQDLSAAAFPARTARRAAVGPVPALLARVGFTGEDGFELYAGTDYGAALWRTLVDAGIPKGLLPCGYRALDSLRLEVGYRVWGSDVTPETNPYEAGLGFCVRLDKPGGFVGAEALRAVAAAGPERRLSCLSLADPRRVVLGGEPVFAAGQVLGRVTSGGYGYTTGCSLAYAYLPTPYATAGTAVTVRLFGEDVAAEVTDPPLRSATRRSRPEKRPRQR